MSLALSAKKWWRSTTNAVGSSSRASTRLACLASSPHGAFYAFPSIHHSGMTSNGFSKRLLEEEKGAVIPGNAFGQCGEGFIRCSYVASLEDIEEALERMGRFVRRHG
jgi:aspartate/methionine/tyrosine aminotransferase